MFVVLECVCQRVNYYNMPLRGKWLHPAPVFETGPEGPELEC
jgi:hypothetical protein